MDELENPEPVRESGFYWVSDWVSGRKEWFVAEWDSSKSKWTITGHYEAFCDNEFDEIDERPIVRPEPVVNKNVSVVD